jgi:hypothetical protein
MSAIPEKEEASRLRLGIRTKTKPRRRIDSQTCAGGPLKRDFILKNPRFNDQLEDDIEQSRTMKQVDGS